MPAVALAETGSWPRQYNTGVTAYRSNDFSQASQLFENATSSRDRSLQQRALYNLGNADFRLGQTQPQQAQQLWQRALKNYESALAIDPKDADAKFNYELVKKRLEELKKQQQQQQQQQQQNQQNQQKDQQGRASLPRGQQQQDQKNQQNKDQGQKQDQQQQNQQQEQSQQTPEDQQGRAALPRDQQQQKAGERQQEQQAKAEQQPQEANGQPQDMDKMQATEMLDNLREDERDWNFFPEVQMKDLKDSSPPAKDW
jgi:Ca-activated chloride channel family protein